jgi:ribose-phosphate pyrophosphokinase
MNERLQIIDLLRSPKGYSTLTFPDGQPHLSYSGRVDTRMGITVRITNSTDLLNLGMMVDVLRREGCEYISVYIAYLMGARMDRPMVEGEPFTLKVVADFINALKLDQIILFDPHSDVAPALLNARVQTNEKMVRDALLNLLQLEHRTAPETLKFHFNNEGYVLVSPDGGALKKIYNLSTGLGGLPVVECSKHRDVSTGKLSGFRVNGSVEGKTCVIVDDICDGGGTFIGLVQELKSAGAKDVHLIVSHGIFSKGLQPLFDGGIKTISTTPSYAQHRSADNFFVYP